MRGALDRSLLSELVARSRSLLRGLLWRDDVESEVAEEFRLHIELRTADLMRSGLSPSEAKRRAHLEFGHAETHREAARAARGLSFFDRLHFSWLDVKLGVRMLWKQPALTLVALFALALGIPVGMAPMHLASSLRAPLPEDEDDRIRAIRYWDPLTARDAPLTAFELRTWAEELTRFEALGGFRSALYNVASEDGRAAPVPVAQVTAAVFDMLGTPALLGRTIDAADEAPSAENVVVIGHDLLRSRFGAESDLLGRTIRVGGTAHTVVGVMPPGFLFPMRQQAWVPLRDPRLGGPGEGPALRVIGRLADGVSAEEAHAEVAAVGVLGPSAAGEDADARSRLLAEVVPFAMLIGLPRDGLESVLGFWAFQTLAVVLLLVACGNVAMLVFARTATRFRELAVRTALGASRGRIVRQIFVESLVLAVLAAGVGLASIDWVLGRVHAALMGAGPWRSWLGGAADFPYWLTLDVTVESYLTGLLLAVLSATVAGVLPALRITGARVQENIQRAATGSSGIRFGGVTGVLIVADVALSVVVVGLVAQLTERVGNVAADPAAVGIAAEEFLAAELRLTATGFAGGSGRAHQEAWTERLATTQRALVDRLRSEPGVRAVAVADALPRMDHRSRRVEIEGTEPGAGGPGRWVRTALVDVDFFDELRRPILAGRGFDRADLGREAPPVIVNTTFAERLMGGTDVVGRRIRFVADGDEGLWREVVGVVGHLGVFLVNPDGDEGVYVPAAPGEIHPVQLGIHVAGAPEEFVPRLRELVFDVDPTVILGTPVPLDSVYPGDWYVMIAVAGGFVLLVAVLVALAASGIYAIMSFSVSERTREIGIRTALGARRSALIYTIVRRSLMQIGVGALLGMPLVARMLSEGLAGEAMAGGSALFSALGLALGMVTVVGLLSCVAPIRRALRIEPTEALRAEG